MKDTHNQYGMSIIKQALDKDASQTVPAKERNLDNFLETITTEGIIRDLFAKRLAIACNLFEVDKQINDYMVQLENCWNPVFSKSDRKSIAKRLFRRDVEEFIEAVDEAYLKYINSWKLRSLIPWAVSLAPLVIVPDFLLVAPIVFYITSMDELKFRREANDREAVGVAALKQRIRDEFKEADLMAILNNNRDYFTKGIKAYNEFLQEIV